MFTLRITDNCGLDNLPELIGSTVVDWNDPFLDGLEIDLSQVTFISPTALTLFATIGQRAQKLGFEVCVTPPTNSNISSYLKRIGFFDFCDTPYLDDRNWHDPSGRFLELVKIEDERQGDIVVERVIEILKNQMSEEIGFEAISHSLAEMVNNVFHHAQSPTTAIVSAQAYPQRRCIEFCVVDSGRGIPASLRDNPKIIFESNQDAIEKALGARITGRPGKNSGEGLFFSTLFLRENQGDGWVYSTDAAARIRSGNLHYHPDLPLWEGTIVSMRFSMDHPVNSREIFNRFAPPENGFEWLFAE